MKILLTGASGLLGREIMKAFSSSRHQITGLAWSRSRDPLLKVNLLNQRQLSTTIDQVTPDLIIHSAAERRPDIVKNNPEQAREMNIGVSAYLAEMAAERDICIFYMSTNYVFDGTSPPYKPEDPPNPLNLYGNSKLQGELEIRKTHPDHLILRLPMLYGPSESFSESPATEIAEKMLKNGGGSFDRWQTRFPTYTPNVAAVILAMVNLRDSWLNGPTPRFLRGTYHYSDPDSTTKFGIAQKAAELLGVNKSSISPVDTQPEGAPRPQNTMLDTSSLKRLIPFPVSDFNLQYTSVIKGIQGALNEQ